MLRMNTPASCACACMRTRSPSMAPPVNGLVGSTARTPTVWPDVRHRETRPSTSVLLPAPGAPVMPTRNARPDRPNSSRTSAGPSSASFSTSEMPRAIPRGSPDTIESASEDNLRNLSRTTTVRLSGAARRIHESVGEGGQPGAALLLLVQCRTMYMRLAVFVLALLAAAPSIAGADATGFLGRNSAGDDRSVTRGFAFGVSLLVIGFEFEYA